MSLLEQRFLLLDPNNPDHVGAATLPYDATRSIKDILDPLVAPGLMIEHIEITAEILADRRCMLSSIVAVKESVAVTPVGGVPQMPGPDYIVSDTNPTYIYWGGLNLEGLISVGDFLVVMYEVASVPLGVPGLTPETPGSGTGFATPVKVTADHTVAESATLMVDSSENFVTIQLPSAAESAGVNVIVKLVDDTLGTVIVPAGSDMIDGVAEELDITILNSSVTLICDGVGWLII